MDEEEGEANRCQENAAGEECKVESSDELLKMNSKDKEDEVELCRSVAFEVESFVGVEGSIRTVWCAGGAGDFFGFFLPSNLQNLG